MEALLMLFLSLIGGYHLIHTFVVHGLEFLSPEILSAAKDLLWLVIVAGIAIWKWKKLK